jgi:hypothetical protein
MPQRPHVQFLISSILASVIQPHIRACELAPPITNPRAQTEPVKKRPLAHPRCESKNAPRIELGRGHQSVLYSFHDPGSQPGCSFFELHGPSDLSTSFNTCTSLTHPLFKKNFQTSQHTQRTVLDKRGTSSLPSSLEIQHRSTPAYVDIGNTHTRIPTPIP